MSQTVDAPSAASRPASHEPAAPPTTAPIPISAAAIPHMLQLTVAGGSDVEPRSASALGLPMPSRLRVTCAVAGAVRIARARSRDRSRVFQLAARERQSEAEDRARAELAFHRQAAAVQIENAFRDRKPEAGVAPFSQPALLTRKKRSNTCVKFSCAIPMPVSATCTVAVASSSVTLTARARLRVYA